MCIGYVYWLRLLFMFKYTEYLSFLFLYSSQNPQFYVFFNTDSVEPKFENFSISLHSQQRCLSDSNVQLDLEALVKNAMLSIITNTNFSQNKTNSQINANRMCARCICYNNNCM